MKEPKSNEASRCLEIRRRSKRGEYISRDDRMYCEMMLSEFPYWYASTEKQVFNETVPFGSNVRME